jgi:hypothetical protein
VTALARDLPRISRITAHPDDTDPRRLRECRAGPIVGYGNVAPDYAAITNRIEAERGTPYLRPAYRPPGLCLAGESGSPAAQFFGDR